MNRLGILLLLISSLSAQMVISRPVRHGRFFDVNSRSSGGWGIEDGTVDAWVYPFRVASGISVTYTLQPASGAPVIIDDQADCVATEVSPESFTRIISSDTATIRETLFAPASQPGIVLLVEATATNPVVVRLRFRPELELMWPGANPSFWRGYDAALHAVTVTDATDHWYSAAGFPAAQLASAVDDPSSVALETVLRPDATHRARLPIVFAFSLKSEADLAASVRTLEGNCATLLEGTRNYFRDFLNASTSLESDNPALDTQFAWAKVAVHRALVDNPFLGLGLVAGYGAGTYNDRPGFAWFFGRDAMWTEFATSAAHDLEASRAALEFLARYQRADGKIPHEISQAATLTDWFHRYPYAWASADSTPMYIAGFADYVRVSGDAETLRRYWPNLQKAYAFCIAMDTDGNALVENENFGHGWIEGGRLFPAHEELYLQGVWLEALRGYAEMARLVGDSNAAAGAEERHARVLNAVEQTYWLPDQGFYSFATLPLAGRPGTASPKSAPRLSSELTALPTVPMWWAELDPQRSRQTLRALASGGIDADWGMRIVSETSAVFDPTGYHYGTVWPLFTGWAAMAAYRYGLPEFGYELLQQNALQAFAPHPDETSLSPAGDVDEVFSGRFYRPLASSSHHQIWSSAMVVSPVLRGLAGLEFDAPQQRLLFAPQLPDDMSHLHLERVPCGAAGCSLDYRVLPNEIRAQFSSPGAFHVLFTASLPADAVFGGALLDGRRVRQQSGPVIWGDMQREAFDIPAGTHEIRIAYHEGVDVFYRVTLDQPGEMSHQPHILGRAYGADGVLDAELEARGGETWTFALRGHVLRVGGGELVSSPAGSPAALRVTFPPGDGYVHTHVRITPAPRRP